VTPGEALAAKRGERGLTIQQAAAATRIQADYLKALEAGDLERLPAPVYAKGYLRALGTGVATRDFSSQTSP
jgi:cytoskeletal protein RodZ